MSDPTRLLTALIHARRSGDRATVNATLTKLVERGIRLMFGDSLTPPRTPKYPVADSSRSGN